MSNELAIRLSDCPVDNLVRIHTEQSDHDEPKVSYLRRNRQCLSNRMPLRIHDPDGHEEFVLAIGKVHVRIHADEDHIRIELCEVASPPRAA